jgi:uncharacterized protein (DUF305 family)
MKNITVPRVAFGLLGVLAAGAGCASAPVSGGVAGAPADPHAMHQAAPAAPAAGAPGSRVYHPTDAQRLLGIRQPWSDADIEFISGMIPHHAQAVIMSGWAASRGARADVALLCERILVSQKDEIAWMQMWLRDRGLPVPDATATKMKHTMMVDGRPVVHEMLMAGMLTDEEMAALEKARGPEFDRLFLTGMIKHHGGAIDMVDKLFKSYGAAQDDMIYTFASDVFADQTIEIEKMKQMLEGRGGR